MRFYGVETTTARASLFVLSLASCGGVQTLNIVSRIDPACPALMADGAPTTPLEFGRRELGTVISAMGADTCMRVTTISDPMARMALDASGVKLDEKAESFAIVSWESTTFVVGRDEVGAMYGAFELAERMRLDGNHVVPLATAITQSPASRVRAANLFLVLPTQNESVWWFYESAFWEEYLDLMARARMNFLDLHAMYNLENTVFPNALLYFGHSHSFPKVGVSEVDRLGNVQMLKSIVAWAAVRGIKVGLLSYRADPSLTGDNQDWKLDEMSLKTYTREAVADIATKVPRLARLGFRIGESQRGAGWYGDSFVAGLHDAGTGVLPYTRSWQIPKKEILGLIQSTGDDYMVEVKMNGEQLGAPYAIAGGAFNRYGWDVYSYQDYLDPPMPYQLIFQVRTGGTHRIFRYASYERTRRTVASFTLGGASGFSVEAPHAFFPQRDFYHQPQDRFSEWTFRRDELFYLLFGRLSYDPTTPERVFRYALKARVGSDELWDAMQAASDIVPWIQVANTCGPDMRDFAPDLEWGGTVAEWAQPSGRIGACNIHGPFDTFAVAGPYDIAADLAAGRTTTRLSPMEVSRIVLDDAARARSLASAASSIVGGILPTGDNAEARDIVRETIALSDLGAYFGHKLRGATALAIYHESAQLDYLDYARSETRTADTAFTNLASDTSYIAPFSEMLRMNNIGIGMFHWSKEVPLLEKDPISIDATVAAQTQGPSKAALPPAREFLEAQRPAAPGVSSFTVDPPDPASPTWTVTVQFDRALPAGSKVRLLWKRFSGLSDWQGASAVATPTGANASYTAVIHGGGHGALFSVEGTTSGGVGFRLPDPTVATPYYTLPPS